LSARDGQTYDSFRALRRDRKLRIATDETVPLLLVFGRKIVGRPSGVYMWDYMNALKDRFHIFVAVNHHVNGKKAYDALMSNLQENSLAPSQQILYLFSGGYGPAWTCRPNS
jgi:hypothetical protein